MAATTMKTLIPVFVGNFVDDISAPVSLPNAFVFNTVFNFRFL